MSEKKVTIIFNPHLKKHRVAIYCRVSTCHESQEDSLEQQITMYTTMVEYTPSWILHDVYADKASGRGTKNRREFTRMISDCCDGKIDIILTKSVSRFGRNIVDALEAINKLKHLQVDIIFESEGLRLSEHGAEFIITILEAVAQSSSESKSEAIKWGINKGFQSGASRLYSRKCYGYTNDENNDLIIDEEQASNVRLIYDLYLRGYSLIAIIRELERQNIKSPTGKVKWSNRAIETVLSNEKYTGRVIVGKTYGDDYPKNKRYINRGERERYLAENTHEPIISNELFEQVQSERSRRSNIEIDADGTVKRRSTHYSVKKNNV